jgi:hypothetical protein
MLLLFSCYFMTEENAMFRYCSGMQQTPIMRLVRGRGFAAAADRAGDLKIVHNLLASHVALVGLNAAIKIAARLTSCDRSTNMINSSPYDTQFERHCAIIAGGGGGDDT